MEDIKETEGQQTFYEDDTYGRDPRFNAASWAILAFLVAIVVGVGVMVFRSASVRPIEVATGRYAYEQAYGVDNAASYDTDNFYEDDYFSPEDMVRSADVEITTRDFDASLRSLKAYFAEHGVNVGSYSEDSWQESKRLYVSVDVLNKDLDVFIEGLKEFEQFSVRSVTVGGTSMSDYRQDLTRRIELLEDVYGRYESLMELAVEERDVSAIVEVQQAMYDIAERLDNLGAVVSDIETEVTTSTVSIQLVDISETATLTGDFGERFTESAQNALTNFVNSIGDVAVDIIGVWPQLVVLAGICVIVVFTIRRKRSKDTSKDAMKIDRKAA